eukprot:GDKI01010130.1.p1 GENE.GDKI01010130.1~~GDKI01010130.1.p1  ORF type:complete len:391 (+),score=111.05 GDKI01010130.1:61-1233(+)
MSAENGGVSETQAIIPIRHCGGCGKDVRTKLSCPTCLKLGLIPVYFCSQECFKASWGAHKKAHKLIPEGAPTADDDRHLRLFRGYAFTGALRPYPISDWRNIPKDIPKTDYHGLGVPISEQKSRAQLIVHTPEQIKRIRASCLLGRQALDLAHSMCKPGVTTDAIDEAVHNFIIANGAYPSPYNYHNFPKSCCTSVNEVVCHGIPDMRPLQEGDIINVDISTYFKGMHGDLNETFCVGEVDSDSKRLITGAYHSMMAAIKECKPGMMYRDIGNIIQKVATGYNLSVVRTYCGHGVGELFHCAPSIPHYSKNKAVGTMKAGHVFTIEPMINLGSWKDKTWPDDWTAVTEDGKRSAQFEHTVLVTETGVEILTARLPTSPPLEFDIPAECIF